MEICAALLNYIPFILLLLFFILPAKKGEIVSLASWSAMLYVLFLAVCIAGSPLDMATDGDRYERGYYNALYNGIDFEYKDVGWIVYEVLCAKLFGTNIWMFWLLTAFIYVQSYNSFAKSYFDKSKILYFLVMTSGMLGFASYGTNTIRQGIAIAVVLFALRKNVHPYLRVLLFLTALTFHKSMALIFLCFYVVRYSNKDMIYILMWVGCLIMSISHFDLGYIFEKIGFIDMRVESYVDSMNDSAGSYNKTGFRWDFLTYSFVPILYAINIICRKKYVDDCYRLFFRLYLLLNAIWLLVIRIPYSDRMAYLSWFLIPFLSLYPMLNKPSFFYSPQIRVCLIMLLYLGVNLMLQFR